MTNTDAAKAAAEKEAAKLAAANPPSHKATEDAKDKKEIAAKVEHDVKVMSLGSKHPDHNPAKGVVVQTPSKEVIEDARKQAQRKHETAASSTADWRDLPESKAAEAAKAKKE